MELGEGSLGRIRLNVHPVDLNRPELHQWVVAAAVPDLRCCRR
jgi:hypothetical protein